MNDRREKKRGKSLGKAWKRADERTHLHVKRQRGREENICKTRKEQKFSPPELEWNFFLSQFFSSLSGWKENIQTGEKVEKKKTPHTLNLILLNYQRKKSNIKI